MRIRSSPQLDSIHEPYLEAVTPFSADAPGASIVGVFSAQVRRCPHRVAVEAEHRSLKYNELDSLSERFARGLIGRNLEPQGLVALHFDDGALLVTAIMGVLKAGFTYTVVDPAAPARRSSQLVSESKARLVVTDTAADVPDACGSTTSAGAVCFDDLLAEGNSAFHLPALDARTPAVMIYTSGSTGRPLCVVHSHGSILDEIAQLTGKTRAGGRDKWLQYASPAFASAIRSTFGALLTGGTLVLYDIRRNGFSRLEETIKRSGITIYRSLPSTFRHFTALLEEDVRFDSVRFLSLGGEMITAKDVEQFNRHFACHCILLTSYGPTECLGACWGFLEHGESADLPRVPMGYARPGKRVEVVDTDGKVVGDGCIGEIRITGRHIADGYRNDADTTKQRFATGSDGTRTFFSGDLGVRDSTGLITHMGRMDFQAKIRGFRVDVFEIEEMMRRVDGVLDAVVVVRGADGDNRLAGYVLSRGARMDLGTAVREFLNSALPDYMVPASIDVLDRFPLNSNGKVDRAAFPEGVAGDTSPAAQVDSGAGSLLQELSDIWAEVLRQRSIEPDRSFTEMGGDSLGAAQVAALITKRIGADVPLWRILGASNLAELAAAVELAENDSGC